MLETVFFVLIHHSNKFSSPDRTTSVDRNMKMVLTPFSGTLHPTATEYIPILVLFVRHMAIWIGVGPVVILVFIVHLNAVFDGLAYQINETRAHVALFTRRKPQRSRTRMPNEMLASTNAIIPDTIPLATTRTCLFLQIRVVGSVVGSVLELLCQDSLRA